MGVPPILSLTFNHYPNPKKLIAPGEQDRLTPPWITREVADAIPNAKFQLVEGEGSSHVLPLERPDDFNRAALAFLQR